MASITYEHLGDVTEMLVCNACHNITPYCEQ